MAIRLTEPVGPSVAQPSLLMTRHPSFEPGTEAFGRFLEARDYTFSGWYAGPPDLDFEADPAMRRTLPLRFERYPEALRDETQYNMFSLRAEPGRGALHADDRFAYSGAPVFIAMRTDRIEAFAPYAERARRIGTALPPFNDRLVVGLFNTQRFGEGTAPETSAGLFHATFGPGTPGWTFDTAPENQEPTRQWLETLLYRELVR